MVPHPRHQQLDPEANEDMSLMSRRTILRRSMLGITGLGLASLLAACGEDDEDLEADTGDIQPPDAPNVDPDEPALPGADDEEDLDDEAEDDD